ncbi:MAG: DUF4179 domain-containing protein [Lachnospiraceae bacterium]|nr:DUF4179 domain-containing protein [Lachnospiraceae bacterium]
MKNRNWNREFPEVPEHVHQTVLSTLAGLDNRKVKKVRRMKKNKIIILAAAMVAVLGMTVSASEIFKWNKKATEVFVADEEQQKNLVTEQIAQEEYQTVSNDGLTIQAIQTIQDNNCFYALFEITAEDESIQITPENSMKFSIDYSGSESPFSMLTWDFVAESRQTVSNSRYFEIIGTKMNPGNEDLNMKIQFTSLNGAGGKALEGDSVLEGNWEFTLNLHATNPVSYEVNREYQIAGCTVMVKEVELTPISMKLVCDGEDVKQLEAMEGVNLDQADSLHSLFVNGIKYQDGTIVEEMGHQELKAGYGDGNGDYEKTARFSSVIDVDKVSALLVGDNMDEIKLQ